MTNLPKLHQALHDADDKEIADALRYLGKAERIAAALNAQPQAGCAWPDCNCPSSLETKRVHCQRLPIQIVENAAPQPQASADADDLALMDEALSAAGYAKHGIYGEAWRRIRASLGVVK